MGGTHGKSAAIYKDGYNLSGQSSNVTLTAECPAEDVTGFGDTWSDHNCIGQKTFTAGITSFYNETSGTGTDTIYWAGLGASAVWSWFPKGTGTIGNKGYSTSGALEVSEPVTVPVGGAIVSDISVTGNGTLYKVQCTGACSSTLSNGSAAFTSIDFSAACTTSTLVGVVHITSISGTDPSVTVVFQESADNSSWADLLTMTAITGSGTTGAQFSTLSSSTAQYNRAKYTANASTTAFTIATAFGRPGV